MTSTGKAQDTSGAGGTNSTSAKVYDIWDGRAVHARGLAKMSLARLLDLAQLDTSSAGRRVARFLASLFDAQAWPLDLGDLSAVDIGVSDDMLVCLDARRWNKGSLFELVANGDDRLQAVLTLHQLQPAKR